MFDIAAFVAKFAPDDIGIQNLDVAMTTLNRNKKSGTVKLTFLTDQDFDLKGTKRIGMVLWFDREQVKSVQKELGA